MRRKEQITVYVDVEQAAALRELSVRTRVPFSVYIRQAVALLLDRTVPPGVVAALPPRGEGSSP